MPWFCEEFERGKVVRRWVHPTFNIYAEIKVGRTAKCTGTFIVINSRPQFTLCCLGWARLKRGTAGLISHASYRKFTCRTRKAGFRLLPLETLTLEVRIPPRSWMFPYNKGKVKLTSPQVL